MKKALFFLFVLISISASAQTYNNEWIDYNKTYYKFKVGTTGLYRISHSTLQSIGLENVPAEHFQLWRNGEEIRIFTSSPSGILSPTDFIEFWGEMNDGKPDKSLYRNADYQLNDSKSLHTDTASYFLTVNVGSNLRFINAANTIPGGALTAEPFFIHTQGVYYTNQINPGYSESIGGSLMYSSAYDIGEGYTSGNIDNYNKAAKPQFTQNITNLYHYTGAGAPNAKLAINIAGNSPYNNRQVAVLVNGNELFRESLNLHAYIKKQVEFPISYLTSATNGTAPVVVRNYTLPVSNLETDRIVVAQMELTYARSFNFGNLTNFKFKLPAKATSSYLEITNFNRGGVLPYLYDLTTGKRYLAELAGSTLKFYIEPHEAERNFRLVSHAPSLITNISTFEERKFEDYTLLENQGDFLFITNSRLLVGENGETPLQDYINYRKSNIGGAYNAKMYLIDQLEDQFAFGIKMHPNSIRNFLALAKQQFTNPIKHVYLIGKGVSYNNFRPNENNASISSLAFMPTFGSPGSDGLLTAPPGTWKPEMSIGRLSVINAQEIKDYFEKLVVYENKMKEVSSLSANQKWTKNILSASGGREESEALSLYNILQVSNNIYRDTAYGATIHELSKSTTAIVEPATQDRIKKIIEDGVSYIQYLGHSSSTTLEFNLMSTLGFNNEGMYHISNFMGCKAGDLFNFNTVRLGNKESISEYFILTPQRGSVAVVGSSNLGVPSNLNVINRKFAELQSRTLYGKGIGEILRETYKYVYETYTSSFNYRYHVEGNNLNGDPSLIFNSPVKPDFIIEDDFVNFNPQIVSVAEEKFDVNIKVMNLGKMLNRGVKLQVKRVYPSGVEEVIKQHLFSKLGYEESLKLELDIDVNRDKGLNKFIFTIDPDNEVEEIFETNNSITKELYILDDDNRLIYPADLSIVRNPSINYYASTANPFAAEDNYRLDIDTSINFNSPGLRSFTINSKGGLLSFSPNYSYNDSVVYYWRVGLASYPLDSSYKSFSFQYITAPGKGGFSQSHYDQVVENSFNRIVLNNDGSYDFLKSEREVMINASLIQSSSNHLLVQESSATNRMSGFYAPYPDANQFVLRIYWIDGKTFKIKRNTIQMDGGGLYGSLRPEPLSPSIEYPGAYHFKINTLEERKNVMSFLDGIPNGDFIAIVNSPVQSNFQPSSWIIDEAELGSGNTLYHKLVKLGFSEIDRVNNGVPFIFAYVNGERVLHQEVANNTSEALIARYMMVPAAYTNGSIISQTFGPAKKWDTMHWNGFSQEANSKDEVKVQVIGLKENGTADTLFAVTTPNESKDVSSIDASIYPYLQLQMQTTDTSTYTPYQLRYWMVTGDYIPEGAIAPNLLFSMKDTVEVGEPLNVKVAFKNISESAFDSVKVKAIVTDRNNVATEIPLSRFRKIGLQPDSIQVSFQVPTDKLVGNNLLYIDVNPDKDQLELEHFNNFLYKNFFVKGDTLNPVLDVTFDGIHILNKDIVSSRPNIVIKLQDESKYLALNDTSLATVFIKYPSGITRQVYFNNDTLRFIPPTQSMTENVANIEYSPSFNEDGEYELIVNAKDRSDNKASNIDYKVAFRVINKAMISNMLNYPNPFTTSTAFVFTITGSEVPQNIRIQILTVTGKVVREITKDELGPLTIGRNITEFKWDGTDQYGQKLANGVYLYRVITNHNGKKLEKFTDNGDNTDQYFNKGYGKMYLMR